MCHKNRGPRCSSCNKPAPRHRCHCPAKHASNLTVNTQYDGLPTYAETITASPISVQSRCGGRGGRGERERLAATWSDDREEKRPELGVVETLDEKLMEERQGKAEEKDEDVKVLTKSVGSVSL